MEALQRSMTVDSAYMEPKAHVFNDLINSKRLEWSRFVSVLIDKLLENVELKNMLKKNEHNYLVNYAPTAHGRIVINTREEKSPLIYYLGGSAYMAYDDIINKINTDRGIPSVPLSQEAPRTHDWDISLQLKPELGVRDRNIIPLVTPILHRVIREQYDRLNQNNYFNNFENISALPALEHDEKELNYDSRPHTHVINNKIELSFLSTDVFINFRLNLVARIGTEIKKNHIIELIFWKKGGESLPQDINQIVKINLDTYAYYVPLPIDLIKSNLASLMNRSVRVDRVAKCRQDYFRMMGIIRKFESIQDIPQLSSIIIDFDYVKEFLRNISHIVPQCVDPIENSQLFKDILTNLKTIPNRGKDQLKLLQYYYDFFITRVELERTISGRPVRPAAAASLSGGYKTKYLKYKQKYLELKTNGF